MIKHLFLVSLFFIPATLPAKETNVAVTEAEARAFCDKWLPNLVGGESSLNKLMTFYSENAVYEDPNVPEGLKGKPAVSDFLRTLLKKYPAWKFEIVSLYPTRKGFVLQYTGSIPVENGKVIKNFRGIDIIELENGKIAKQQGYYDRHVFFE